MRTFKLFPLAVLTAPFLTACGDDVTKVSETANPELEIVASADSLGKCTAERSGEMKLASKENAVFVCADSVWKNVSAAQNASCFAESLGDSLGYKIICGGDSVGVVFSGKNGLEGENGEAGAEGKSCSVEKSPLPDSGVGYVVVCGSDTVGTLRDGLAGENCTFSDNGDGSVMQICGEDSVTLYKAFCGGKSYDPDSSFCYEDSVVSLCGGKTFNPTENFCFGELSYIFCNGKSYNPKDSVCHNERLYGFFEDSRDKQVYRTVRIGDQIWMAENLNYAAEENSYLCTIGYGRLYLWRAAMEACPKGWHLPSKSEWETLFETIGGIDSAGKMLKSTSGWNRWSGKDLNGIDSFGFSILPAGFKDDGENYGGKCSHQGYIATFWSSTEKDDSGAYGASFLQQSPDDASLGFRDKTEGKSVRCLLDSN